MLTITQADAQSIADAIIDVANNHDAGYFNIIVCIENGSLKFFEDEGYDMYQTLETYNIDIPETTD